MINCWRKTISEEVGVTLVIFVNSTQNLHLVQFSYWSPRSVWEQKREITLREGIWPTVASCKWETNLSKLIKLFAFLSMVIQPILTRRCFELPARRITPSPLLPTCHASRKWLVYSMASSVPPPTLHPPPCHSGTSVPLAWEAQPQAFWVEWTWKWCPTQSCVTKEWSLEGPHDTSGNRLGALCLIW